MSIIAYLFCDADSNFIEVMASQDPTIPLGTWLDTIEESMVSENEADGPYKNHTSMTGFAAQAWIESAQPYTARAEPFKYINNSPTKTIYELITTSASNSELAKVLLEHPDVASILQDTNARYATRTSTHLKHIFSF
jgi:hypothetical protein